MATITMALDKPKGFDGFNKDENPKTSSILKPIKYAIIGMTVVGGVYGAKELIQNFKNPNNKNNITNVVKADSTETNINPDKIANYNDVNKKTPKFELLGGDNGELLIDRSTYKISCINCLPDNELNETLTLLNSTKITDVNKYTVVAAFMWIEDNLPEDQQLNNKIAVLTEYGTDEGTITNKGEGLNPFRYDYDKVDSNIKSITDWFLSQSASPLSFITRLCNDYGIPIETTVDNTTDDDDLFSSVADDDVAKSIKDSTAVAHVSHALGGN